MLARDDSYNIASGADLYAGRAKRLPLWRQGMAQWEWKELAGTTMNGLTPTSPPTGWNGSARINTWSPLVADRVRNKLYAAANGGHNDSSGNEVVAADLSVDAPGAWTFLRQPSATGDVQDAAGATTHYLDGRAPSAHGYYAGHHVPSIDKIVKIGAAATWSTANGSFAMYAFDLATNDWDGAGSYPNTSWAAPSVSNGYGGQAQDLSTGDIYFTGPSSGGLRRFNAATSTYTTLAAIGGVNDDYAYYRPMGYDHTRGKLLLFGDAYLTSSQGRVWTNDGGSGSWATVNFGGLTTAFSGANAFGAEYVEAIDRFVAKTNTGADILLVHPTTYDVTSQSTTAGGSIANASQGVFGRFRYFPRLRGFAYYPAYTSDIWFLATET